MFRLTASFFGPNRRADSIMGVTLFRESAPDNFGNFVRGLSTMFRLTAGDTWIDGIPAYDESCRLVLGVHNFRISAEMLAHCFVLFLFRIDEIPADLPAAPTTRAAGSS